MTSLPTEKVIRRIKTIQNQVKPSDDLLRELSTFTFDSEKLKDVFYKLRPELFHTVQDVVERVYTNKGPGHHLMEKEEMRLETNKLAINVISTLIDEGHVSVDYIIENLDQFLRSLMATGVINPSTATKFSVHYFLYAKTIKNLGTAKHREYLRRAADLTDFGAFGMTELGHGSNVQALETTAHYDHDTKSFILNSPTDTSIKFWIGNLGKTCSMLVTFAQLYVGGDCKGVHVFLVPVRDQTTHEPFEGCIIGDCGDKLGLQGVDNGWIKFTNYRISRDMLLNKIADVNEDGVYSSKVSSSGKRFGCHMAALSGGRVLAASNAADVSMVSTITALRYGATRQQFSRERNGPETQILDYPLHQARIFPLFARGLMEMITMQSVWEDWCANSKTIMDPTNKSGEYFHLLSSAMKAVFTWNAFENWKESRLACGGLGFSAYNNFNEIGAVADVNQTWEGENYVLIQQACKLLLKNFSNIIQGKESMQTCEFMTADGPEEYKFEGSFNNLNHLLDLFSYRANQAVHESIVKIQLETMKEKDERLSKGGIWEKHLYYSFIPMVKVYLQRYVLIKYMEFLENFHDSPRTKEVLTKLALIHLQNVIINEQGAFRHIVDAEQIEDLKESCIKLGKELRPEIVALTFTLPIKDKTFGAVGKSTLTPYSEYMKGVTETPKCYGKPEEWKYLYQSKL